MNYEYNDIILNVVIPYIYDINTFLNLRLTCKYLYHEITDKYLKNFDKSKLVYTCKTFVRMGNCWLCNNSDHIIPFKYIHDDYPNRIIITCNSWRCRFNAIFKYISDINYTNKILLVSSFDYNCKTVIRTKSNDITIPENILAAPKMESSNLLYIIHGHLCIIFKFSYKYNLYEQAIKIDDLDDNYKEKLFSNKLSRKLSTFNDTKLYNKYKNFYIKEVKHKE